jgi:hypothetical protein
MTEATPLLQRKPEAPVFPLGTVNVTRPQTIPNREHSAIRQIGRTTDYTCKGYLEHPAAKTESREPVDVMVDSGNTTAATAAISLTCATRLGLKWEKIADSHSLYKEGRVDS